MVGLPTVLDNITTEEASTLVKRLCSLFMNCSAYLYSQLCPYYEMTGECPWGGDLGRYVSLDLDYCQSFPCGEIFCNVTPNCVPLK